MPDTLLRQIQEMLVQLEFKVNELDSRANQLATHMDTLRVDLVRLQRQVNGTVVLPVENRR